MIVTSRLSNSLVSRHGRLYHARMPCYIACLRPYDAKGVTPRWPDAFVYPDYSLEYRKQCAELCTCTRYGCTLHADEYRTS